MASFSITGGEKNCHEIQLINNTDPEITENLKLILKSSNSVNHYWATVFIRDDDGNHVIPFPTCIVRIAMSHFRVQVSYLGYSVWGILFGVSCLGCPVWGVLLSCLGCPIQVPMSPSLIDFTVVLFSILCLKSLILKELLEDSWFQKVPEVLGSVLFS